MEPPKRAEELQYITVVNYTFWDFQKTFKKNKFSTETNEKIYGAELDWRNR